MIDLSIFKQAAKDLLEIFEYMQHGVFDANWHSEQATVEKLIPMLTKKIKEVA